MAEPNDKKVEKEKKKQEKAAKRAEKKEAKKLKKGGDSQEKEGNKFAIFIVTLIIILVWIGILVLLIKLDFGGFGSTVLRPILKDVPYINVILPDTVEDDIESNSNYPYATLDDAIEQIKVLELELQKAQEANSSDNSEVDALKEEIKRLKTYEENQKSFEEIRNKFYEEVVFNDKAPDINEYKKYYESINPTNAEAIYKQVISQIQEDEEAKEYSNTYASMKPKQAAAILEQMTDNLDLVARILKNIDVEARGSILGAMDSEIAAKVTKIMEP